MREDGTRICSLVCNLLKRFICIPLTMHFYRRFYLLVCSSILVHVLLRRCDEYTIMEVAFSLHLGYVYATFELSIIFSLLAVLLQIIGRHKCHYYCSTIVSHMLHRLRLPVPPTIFMSCMSRSTALVWPMLTTSGYQDRISRCMGG
jgi:hypothetical protein